MKHSQIEFFLRIRIPFLIGNQQIIVKRIIFQKNKNNKLFSLETTVSIALAEPSMIKNEPIESEQVIHFIPS